MSSSANSTRNRILVIVVIVGLLIAGGVFLKVSAANKAQAIIDNAEVKGACWAMGPKQMTPVDCDDPMAKFVTTKIVDNYHGCTDYYLPSKKPKMYICVDAK